MKNLSIIGNKSNRKRRDLVAELNEKYSNIPKSESNKETKPTQTQKANKLEKDLEGKPEITLTTLKETAVNPQTQEQYDTLMQVYGCGGWRWIDGILPTEQNYWSKYKEKTCVDAGISYLGNFERRFLFGDRKFFEEYKRNIISTKDFYKKQNISQDQIKEINQYFKNKK